MSGALTTPLTKTAPHTAVWTISEEKEKIRRANLAPQAICALREPHEAPDCAAAALEVKRMSV